MGRVVLGPSAAGVHVLRALLARALQSGDLATNNL